MSLFYNMYLSGDREEDNIQNIKKSIIKLIPPIPMEIGKTDPQIIEDSENKFSIWCEYFWLLLINGGQSVEFKNEDYKVEFQYQLLINVYVEYDNWYEELLSFISRIMVTHTGDCLFEFNGDTPLMMRINNILTIDKRYLTHEKVNTLTRMGLNFSEGELS